MTFTPKEDEAIKALAQMMDLTPEAVVRQSIRLFQLHKFGHVQITFPAQIIDATCTTVEDTKETPTNPQFLQEETK